VSLRRHVQRVRSGILARMSAPLARPSSPGSWNDLPQVLVEMVQRGEVLTPDGRAVPVHSGVSLDEALVLYRLVRERRPLVSLEIGYAMGHSGLAILKALEDNGAGTHHAIDPEQSRAWSQIGAAVADRARLRHRLVLHEAFPEEIVPSMPRAQFAFIDGAHVFDLILLDFVLTDKRLDVGGIVVLHDTWMPAVQAVLRYVLANRAYRPVQLTGAPRSRNERGPLARLRDWARGKPRPVSGPANLAILEKTSDDARPWNHHVAF
jgi:predicted O-methyltransferase YrrM